MTLAFTDHHIQDMIIHALATRAMRFSELVPPEMEHSHFMYHLKKLLARGVVEKAPDGEYALTLEGAKLYNARFQLEKPLQHIRTLVQFVVLHPDGEHVLMTRRHGALAQHLTEYMLPGGLHFHMASSRQSAASNAKSRGFLLGEFLSTLETINKAQGYHGLIDIYAATLAGEPKNSDNHQSEWLQIEDVCKRSFAEAGSAPFVLKHLQEDTLLPRMTYYVDSELQ